MAEKTNLDGRCLRIVFGTYAICMSLTYLISQFVGAPFSLWFNDGHFVVVAAFFFLVFFGVIWDGALILLGVICENLQRRQMFSGIGRITVETVRKFRFFTCGLTPLVLIVLTAFALLGTSNITLISLKLLGPVTSWRDPYLWEIEKDVLLWLTRLPINVTAWDTLYHGCWPIEFFAAFVLVLLGRGARLVLYYCVSMIVLFYIGRLLGVVNPVMGPAFFKPELFGYLDHSITRQAMQLVSSVMAQPPEQAIEHGGVLLGGVSAMPSLHVAMVAVTSYWLAAAKRWTLVVTVPWVLLVWSATVVLGWHYILDGAGGIALGSVSVVATNALLRRLLRDTTDVARDSQAA
ncbi:PAP2 superfamily protein [Formivibrio citricus]|uniref:PAP2 superfamily protein n=1 Tax=Formivibrio citricus TaxID=83765 RepID=A0A1I4WX37_9NEIS|nr:phosphatase PAP2 family protein [Formivibrio citricus]SFN18321.1 PAP2 superfamily protein [Formivibrio citricus]